MARSLPEIARKAGFSPTLWIASAGYGLIPADAPIKPYSATFARRSPDTVAASTNGTPYRQVIRGWWDTVCSERQSLVREPASLRALTQLNKNQHVLLVASPAYVYAMEHDIQAALAVLSKPDRLVIVCSAGDFSDPTQNHVVESNARLQSVVQGARPSLHARVARKILHESSRWPLTATNLRKRYKRLTKAADHVKSFDRERFTDAEVQRYIRSELRRSPGVSQSRLLRAFRDSGRACEQARFKKLYHEVIERYGC